MKFLFIIADTCLLLLGDVTMTTGRQTFGLNPTFVKSDLNLFLLPCMDAKPDTQGRYCHFLFFPNSFF